MITALAGNQFSCYSFVLARPWVEFSTLVAARWLPAWQQPKSGRVQGVADLATTSLVAMASLTAGGLHGWLMFLF